jgi:hypothetical protein
MGDDLTDVVGITLVGAGVGVGEEIDDGETIGTVRLPSYHTIPMTKTAFISDMVTKSLMSFI